MNRFFFGILILTACSSCQVYQYNILNSSFAGTHDEPFTFENDTLRIIYSFDNGQCDIEIYNKLKTGLYVDWSRSAVIINGESRSYWAIKSPDFQATYSTGLISFTTPISFIPPYSRIYNIPLTLPDAMDLSVPNHKYPKNLTFSEQTSPLAFRSYLLLSTSQNFSEPLQFDHHFWISEIQRYSQNVPVTPKQNAYMTSHITKAGNVAFGAVLAGLVIGSFVLATDAPQPQPGQ